MISDANNRTDLAISDLRSDTEDAINEAKQYANNIVVGAESSFSQTVNGFKMDVSKTYATKEALQSTNDELNAQTRKVEKYLTFGDDYLVIGTNENKFNVQITNEAINFRNGEQVLAYMTNQKLYISESQVTTSQQIGSYMWMLPNSRGAVALIYVGSEAS